ncbi:MAG: hypothetical protein ACTSRC_21700 [Candidatus Helarchaeota archaeon]
MANKTSLSIGLCSMVECSGLRSQLTCTPPQKALVGVFVQLYHVRVIVHLLGYFFFVPPAK